LRRVQPKEKGLKTLPPRDHKTKQFHGSYGKYPRVNSIDTNSSINVFARENLFFVWELSSTLDIYKERVVELEEKLKFQKPQLEDDFKQQSNETK